MGPINRNGDWRSSSGTDSKLRTNSQEGPGEERASGPSICPPHDIPLRFGPPRANDAVVIVVARSFVYNTFEWHSLAPCESSHGSRPACLSADPPSLSIQGMTSMTAPIDYMPSLAKAGTPRAIQALDLTVTHRAAGAGAGVRACAVAAEKRLQKRKSIAVASPCAQCLGVGPSLTPGREWNRGGLPALTGAWQNRERRREGVSLSCVLQS